MHSLSSLTLFGLAMAATSPAATCTDGGLYQVGDSTYSNHASYTFESGAFPDGLRKSDYEVNDLADSDTATKTHTFNSANVNVVDGYLELTVRGPTTGDTVSSAEVVAADESILYGSFRTVAILPQTPGVVVGFFTYSAQNGEQDIEFLTNLTAQSNDQYNTGLTNLQSPPMQLTNHASDFKNSAHAVVASPNDAQSAEHEYRLDWSPGQTQFFIDGQLVKTLTDYVPSGESSFIINTWANGDYQFSTGPPDEDAVTKIKSLELYYNSSANAANDC